MNRPPVPPRRTGPVGRYAPSPTGDLHPGNLRTALVAWERCRSARGTFILRIEDIDGPRTVPGSEERMIEDLRWLGLDWDEGPDVGGPVAPYRQSERGEIYQAALESLERAEQTYLCTCSRKDLREATAPHAGEGGAAYPGICRDKPAALQREDPRGAAVRLRLPEPAMLHFQDLYQGPQSFDLGEVCGDFVLLRRDGLWAYQFACAVDDALMGVTEVIRGADLLDSTPRQIAVMGALGLPIPDYGHVPLVADADGRRMSKRDGSISLRTMREEGRTPEEVRAAIMAMPLMEIEVPE